MFVLRILVVLVVVCTFGNCAEAQLFRLRANVAQQPGIPSRYDARAYQYTQPQPQVTFVPSQRTAFQAQRPACNNQQQVLVPANSLVVQRQQQLQQQPLQQLQQQQVLVQANSVAAQRQQQLQQQQLQQQAVVRANAVAAQRQQQLQQLQRQQLQQRQLQARSQTVIPAAGTEVVTVVYRDRSGRPFQRQYLVQRPGNAQVIAPQVAVVGATQQVQTQTNQVGLPALPGQASSIGISSPELNPSGSTGVQTTSFESPTLEAAVDTPAEFSVLNSENGTEGGSVSVLESSLPVLEAPGSSEAPGSILESSGEIDLDLPPLELDDSQ